VTRRTLAVLVFLGHVLPIHAATPQPRQQQITPSPVGPFHIEGNRLIDSQGRPFLMRGTQLKEFHQQTAAQDASSGLGFGPHSATSLTAIRLRFNMNTVRLPLDVAESDAPGYFPELARLVHRANATDLLVVLFLDELAAREPETTPARRTAEFWSRCAAFFKNAPNVIFDVSSDLTLVNSIRSAGARQPIAVRWNAASWNAASWNSSTKPDDANLIYEFTPPHANTLTDTQRDAQFGSLADRVPVLATGWDLNLDDPAQCSALPSDPSATAQLVQANLDYFDAHQISWTVSVFEPGKLIKDAFDFHATSLENGWTCGRPDFPAAGLGRVVQAHLRAGEERGLFVVSSAGGLDVPRGGFAIAYGPVMAQRDEQSKGPAVEAKDLPLTLGGIAVKVTDTRGVTRPAGMFWASAGWGQVNFVIPADSAPGPARMTIERADTSRQSANITIADTAPGFWTGVSCRGPAEGTAIQVFAGGRTARSPISRCQAGRCSTLPIPMTDGAITRVQLRGSGFRYARSAAEIEVTIDGIRVPVLSFGPSTDPGVDQLIIELPPALAGRGEADMLCHIRGRVSNAVQIRVGQASRTVAGFGVPVAPYRAGEKPVW
jgi:uncharacterized protein (TIGR03437 family)